MSISIADNEPYPFHCSGRSGFYENRLKATLELDHMGEFVAIEPVAARYFSAKPLPPHSSPLVMKCQKAAFISPA